MPREERKSEGEKEERLRLTPRVPTRYHASKIWVCARYPGQLSEVRLHGSLGGLAVLRVVEEQVEGLHAPPCSKQHVSARTAALASDVFVRVGCV
eukprot:546342-Rhodomonas_salina.1